MTTEPVRKIQLVWLAGAGLGLFAGFCSIFVLVVTVAQGWQERAQAQWPQAKAQVQRCGLDTYTHRRIESYWINCRISYLVGAEQIVTQVHSRSASTSRRVILQHPALQFGLMQAWVDQHPPGTPITVRYDPAKHQKAVLAATDMPLAGPRTPENVKLLEVTAGICALLLAIAGLTRSSYGVVGKRSP
ncbi:MAG: DUF3592 domain-containing protein [Candidatus Sulfotelmatobacter sp.]